MKNSNTLAALFLSAALVLSTFILAGSLKSLGKSIERTAGYSTNTIKFPDNIRVNLKNIAPIALRLENSPGGASLRIQTEEK